LIESHFQKTLSKASQKADWSKRPLSTTMLHYAVDDVRYLLELADILQGQLSAKSRIPWFLQGCDALRDGVASRPTTPKEDPWRIQGSGKLHGRGLAVLKELWTWRDKIAQERDVPCFRVISNKQILDVAIAVERGVDVHPPAGWRPKWKRDFELILQTVSEGSEDSWPQRLRPKGARLSDAARDQLDRLCQLRETLAAELDLEPALLGGRSVLEGVVATAEGVEDLLPWQREVLGDHLVKAREALGFVITEA
jgi:ribonuclease D